MLKLELFARRNFAVGNLETLAMYAGLAILFFFLVIFLQQVAGYSALESGLATLPMTLVMFALSRRFGALADRYGPRLFMGAGPLDRGGRHPPPARAPASTRRYVSDLLPALLVFSLGLTMTVAPLTATVLADADETRRRHRVGRQQRRRPRRGTGRRPDRRGRRREHARRRHVRADDDSVDAFHRVVVICAVLVAAGGVVGALGIANPRRVVEAKSAREASLSESRNRPWT